VSETHIGTRIREARCARKLSQQQLAQRVNISVRTLRAYEHNKRSPDEETLHKIADVLEFPVHYFLRTGLVTKTHLLFICKLDEIFGSSNNH
jgi:transcriptional regulator with XRE-family HTH domain